MQKLKFLALAIFLGFVALPAPAWAWSKGGHMVTGAITYDLMKKDSPDALTRVIALLQKHPQYDNMFAPKLEKTEAADRDRTLLMWAARWPDDIRDDPEYHHSKWHYIDFPFKPKGQPDSVGTADPDPVNAVVALRTNFEILNRAESSDAEKAVAICWLLHIIGDIHQPLHTVSLFTTDYPAPEGDQGGNKFKIRAREDSKPISLHWFWDGLIVGGDEVRETGNKAIELRNEYPRSKLKEIGKQVSAGDIDRWVQESFQLARRSVYRQGKLIGNPVEKNAPVLPEGYSTQVQPLAQRRAVLASYRMAAVIVQAVSPTEKSK
jgi:hypothetical protein